jgi:hypothetical protein
MFPRDQTIFEIFRVVFPRRELNHENVRRNIFIRPSSFMAVGFISYATTLGRGSPENKREEQRAAMRTRRQTRTSAINALEGGDAKEIL